jgi:hypothetical protein
LKIVQEINALLSHIDLDKKDAKATHVMVEVE